MSDKSELQQDQNRDDDNNTLNKGIFDEQLASMINQFGESCEHHRIMNAIIIMVNPVSNKTTIFMRGHEYDTAVLMTRVLVDIKSKLMAELNG